MAPAEVEVAMGRSLAVPRAAGGVCCFTYAQLCGANVGASDYIALVAAYHTIALKSVPVFTSSNANTAYRFVKLVDLMYEHRVKALISAEAYAHELFRNVCTVQQGRDRSKGSAAGGSSSSAELVVDDNLGFAKDRTVSRLIEMQTVEYAVAHARHRDASLLAALEEAAEKKRATG